MANIIKRAKRYEWKWDFYHVSCLVLGALFAAQLFACLYLNLFALDSHVGYDSSWYYLRAALMWDKKALTSPDWTESTGLFFDSAMPIASILYGITGNILISFGIADNIILILMAVALYSLLKSLNVSLRSSLVGLNLLICPLSISGFQILNDLGYFSSAIVGAAFYSGRMLALLLIMRSIVGIEEKKSLVWVVSSLVLSFISGMSVGVFLIVLVVIPLFMYLAEKAFIKNDIKVLIKKEAVYTYLLAASVFAGKLVTEYVLGFQSDDDTKAWTAIENIWKSLGAVIQGYFKLFRALPNLESAEVPIMSAKGMLFIPPLLLLFVCMISVGFGVCRVVSLGKKRVADAGLLLPVNLVLVNILIFTLFDATYGADIFEERYLLLPFAAVIVILCIFLDSIGEKELLTYSLMAAVTLSIMAIDVVGDIGYIRSNNDNWQMKEIVSCIDETDCRLVYIWTDNWSTDTFGRALRVMDLSRIYKCVCKDGRFDSAWGEYTYLDNNEDYSGPTIMIYEKGKEKAPPCIDSRYRLYREFDIYDVYVSDENPVDVWMGITSDRSVDYPYSLGMHDEDGICDENGNLVIVSTSDGYKLKTPKLEAASGEFDFTVFYTVVQDSEGDARFDVMDASGENVTATAELSDSSGSATIRGVAFEEGTKFRYGVYVPENMVIIVDRIEITRAGM